MKGSTGPCPECMPSSCAVSKLWHVCAVFSKPPMACPLSVILINLLTSIWKRVMDAQAQAIQVSANRMPPGGSPTEALSFIITALGYADDIYGLGTV